MSNEHNERRETVMMLLAGLVGIPVDTLRLLDPTDAMVRVMIAAARQEEKDGRAVLRQVVEWIIGMKSRIS